MFSDSFSNILHFKLNISTPNLYELIRWIIAFFLSPLGSLGAHLYISELLYLFLIFLSGGAPYNFFQVIQNKVRIHFCWCRAGWKCTKKLMWYTYEVCNKINLLKNVEKDILMYSQFQNSLLSNVVTKSNLQMQYLIPILRMLISELKVHFFRCNFSHILILLWQPKKC